MPAVPLMGWAYRIRLPGHRLEGFSGNGRLLGLKK